MTTDAKGYTSRNPLFMRYTPNDRGEFSGQQAYGYQSFQQWVEACSGRNKDPHSSISSQLALMDRTIANTAILEAGRRSLDAGGLPIQLQKTEEGNYKLISS